MPDLVRVSVQGEAELERAWSDVSRIVERGVQTGVRQGVLEGAYEARTKHAYEDRTGTLTRSIRGYVETSAPGGAVGVIEATAHYASYVEKGTRPHLILPRDYHWGAGRYMGAPRSRVTGKRVKNVTMGVGRGYALRWYDLGGKPIFARKVNHPGSQPKPFMGIALLKAERVIIREVEIAVADAQRRLNG